MRGVGKYSVRRFVVFTPLIIALLWVGLWGLRQTVKPPTRPDRATQPNGNHASRSAQYAENSPAGGREKGARARVGRVLRR